MKTIKVSEMIKEPGWVEYKGGRFPFKSNDEYFTFVTREELNKEVEAIDFTPLPKFVNDIERFDDDNSRAILPDYEITHYRIFSAEEAEEFEETLGRNTLE